MPQLRAPYSPAFDFIALRGIDHGTEHIGPGEPFPKASVEERRLRLLYDALWIEPLVPGYRDPRAGNGPHDLVPADYYVQQHPHVHELHAWEGEGGALHPGEQPERLAGESIPPAVKHLGFGKWSVVVGDVVIHAGPLTRKKAEALAAGSAVPTL